MTVYLDELFAVNLVMDWLILWATGNLAQCGSRWQRLGMAAFLGAVYSAMILFTDSYWLTSLPVKTGWSFLMLYIAYPRIDRRSYLKLVIYFYLISFVLAGASMAAMYLFGQPAVQTWSGIALVEIDFQLFWLAIGVGMTGFAVYTLRNRLRQDITAQQQIVAVRMHFENRSVRLRLLVDSGHSLTDPLSGKSVLVAEIDALLPLFSESIQALLKAGPVAAEEVVKIAEQPGMAGRWRMIPYRAVGGEGLLAGFRPDCIEITDAAIAKQLPRITVAMSSQKFSRGETYQGLISLDLL